MRKLVALIILLWASISLAAVTSETSSVSYTCNGSTTAYSVPFRFLDNSHLVVTRTDLAGTATTLSLATHYSVTGSGGTSGTVTLVSGSTCLNGFGIQIKRVVPLTQPTVLNQHGPYLGKVHEVALDRTVMEIQTLKAELAALQAWVDVLVAGSVVVFPQTWTFTGDGASTSFVLGGAQISDSSSYVVTVNGLVQAPSTYVVSLVGNTITFTIAPALAASISVRGLTYAQQAPAVNDASTVTATGSTTARSLATRFAETVNVKDYGAVGDGVADDTAAFEDAIAVLNARARLDTYEYATGSGGTLYIPRGVYKITRPLSVNQDSVVIAGEGKGAATLLFRLASNPSTTDALTLGGDGTNGRNGEVRDIQIISDSNWGVSPGFRDGVVVNGGYWGSMTNVMVRGAYRYGIRIRGTGGTTYRGIRTSYNGDSGLRIELSAGGVEPTTTAFYGFVSQYNKKFGAHIANRSVHVTFTDSIFEYNGYATAGGTAVDGSGIRMGDAGVDNSAEVFLVNPYFENNTGWDIETGAGMGSGNVAHFVQIFGGRASTVAKVGYGFFYGYWAWGQAVGMLLNGYNGGATASSYTFDSTCRFSVLGTATGQGATTPPVYRSGTGALNDYTGGIVQWWDGDGHLNLYGRYIPRVGGPGSADSFSLTRDSASPTVGTYRLGSLAFNYAPTSAQDSLFGWRATASGAGAAANWVPVYTSTKPLDNLASVTQTGGGSKTPDVNARTTRYVVGDATGFTINQPSNMVAGRVFTIWIYNNVGAAMGTITWAGQYRFAGAAAPASPISGRGTLVTFVCDTTVAYEVSRSVDVSN